MRIATFNCNSIRTRLGAVLDWCRENEPDVLALQETKVEDALFPREAIEAAGYRAVFRGMKAYNGVAILSREAATDISSGLADGGPADEPRLLRATVGGVTIVNTYVPQGRAIDHVMFRYKIEWFGRLRKYFGRNFRAADPVVWLGDCNVAAEAIDVHNPEERADHVCYHEEACRAFADCRAWGFTDVFRALNPQPGHYTFFDYRTYFKGGKGEGWRLDYILATPPVASRAKACRIDMKPRLAERPSDHTFVVADIG